jgi:hypothetical protein
LISPRATVDRAVQIDPAVRGDHRSGCGIGL